MKNFEYLYRTENEYESVYIYENNNEFILKHIKGNKAPFIDIKYAKMQDYKDNQAIYFAQRSITDNEIYELAQKLINTGVAKWLKRYVGRNASAGPKWHIRLNLNKTLRISSQGADAYPEEWETVRKIISDSVNAHFENK